MLILLFLVNFVLKSSQAWPEDVLRDFAEWKEEFGQDVNLTCEAELNIAINNVRRNKLRIQQHNLLYKNCSCPYSLGMWEYSNYTEIEIDVMLNGLRPTDEVQSRAIFIGGYELQYPKQKNFDWTAEGAVSPVRNQGRCACCYALASTGALEGQIFRKFNYMAKLSDQQLIDCSDSYGNAKCQYGNPIHTYNYIKNEGISLGYNYPFKARASETCGYDDSMRNTTLLDYRYVPIPNDDFLLSLLWSVGPLVVGVYGSLFSFQNYKSGIYNDPECYGKVNHAMLLVGWGTDPKDGDYWILKNSYGRTWGESGFMRMTRAVPNFCGIWNFVVFPIVKYD